MRKTKSGLPIRSCFRRQPVSLCVRKISINRNSVALLPRERIHDITSDRFALVKTSGMGRRTEVGGDLERAFGFVLFPLKQPVVEPGPLCVARVKLFVG